MITVHSEEFDYLCTVRECFVMLENKSFMKSHNGLIEDLECGWSFSTGGSRLRLTTTCEGFRSGVMLYVFEGMKLERKPKEVAEFWMLHLAYSVNWLRHSSGDQLQMFAITTDAEYLKTLGL